MKKGQVTIFIILGIIILMVVGIGIYLAGRSSRAPLEQQISQPATFEPRAIREYGSACLEKTAEEGIYTIAAQGGYLNPRGDANLLENGDGLPVHYFTENS